MKLTVIQNSIDLTLKMDDFTNPEKRLDLSVGEILIGFHKPIKNFYVELKQQDPLVEGTLSLKYFDGATFVDVPKLEDRTLGLSRSGFIFLDELEQKKTSFTSKEMYWLKLSTNLTAQVEINGINLVLSNDSDFGLIPNISDYLPEGRASFIGFHQEARNLVIQEIRNSGKLIRDCKELNVRMVDQFDLLDIQEFRQAAKYMALHLIFDYQSQVADDKYAVKAKTNLERAYNCMSSRLMSIDSNDNGKTDPRENQAMGSIRVVRE